MNRADSVTVAYPLFQAEGGGSIPTSALQLFFRSVDLRTARRLNARWHSRLPRFARPACRVAYTAEFDGHYFAVAIWTNPLARMLPQLEWIELNRLAIAPDAPKNTASRMLAWMARNLRERFPDVTRAISYQDLEVHSGSIYRAAGWMPTAKSNGGEWASVSKVRAASICAGEKQRWEKVIR